MSEIDQGSYIYETISIINEHKIINFMFHPFWHQYVSIWYIHCSDSVLNHLRLNRWAVLNHELYFELVLFKLAFTMVRSLLLKYFQLDFLGIHVSAIVRHIFTRCEYSSTLDLLSETIFMIWISSNLCKGCNTKS